MWYFFIYKLLEQQAGGQSIGKRSVRTGIIPYTKTVTERKTYYTPFIL